MTNNNTSTKPMSNPVAIINGTRTPFMRSNGAYASLMGHELGRHAVNGLIEKSQIDPKTVDLCVMGCVISDPKTSNIAREIVLSSKTDTGTPAFTVSMACISANIAISSAANQIRLKHSDVAIAGGAETFSDPPIRLSKKLRQLLAQSQKAKGFNDYFKLFMQVKPKDIALDVPSAAEFSTGHSMGEGCERMSLRFGVSRPEADAFALRSHLNAAQAWTDGRYDQDIVTVNAPPDFKPVSKDDGPRADTTLEGLSKLKPAFDKKFGVSTAGSSSFFSDGASAILLMSNEAVHRHQVKPIAYLVDEYYAAGDPLEELLLGPGLTIPMLLKRNGLEVKDIDVWEFHEAFAAQVVANLKFLSSDTLVKARLGLDKALPEIPIEKINRWGGSLSLGHPFGATGGRLVLTAARRLDAENGEWAVVASCAAGAQGSAMLIRKTI